MHNCMSAISGEQAPPDRDLFIATDPGPILSESFFTTRNVYYFFGLASLSEAPPEMLPNLAFSPVPLTLTNIFVMHNATGPCGKVDWVRGPSRSHAQCCPLQPFGSLFNKRDPCCLHACLGVSILRYPCYSECYSIAFSATHVIRRLT